MRTVLCLLAAATASLASLEASAVLTLLPGSSPQRVVYGQPFAPVVVRVTDGAGAPVPGVQVSSFHGATYPGGRCSGPDGGFTCDDGVTDLDGLLRLQSFESRPKGAKAVTSTYPISAYRDGVYYGSAVVELTGIEQYPIPALKLTAVAGENQRAPLGAALSRPLAVRVTGLDGKPVAGVPVLFTQADGDLDVQFLGNPEGTALSDQDGIATSPLVLARKGVGRGTILASIYDDGAQTRVSTAFAFRATTPDGRTDRELEDMWWSGFEQNGWGISIAQREDRLFPVIFAYDDNGNPTWRVLAVGRWESSAHYEGYLAFPYSPRGSPYYAYDVSRFKVGPQGSAVRFNFPSEQSATMELTSGSSAPSLTKTITRQDYRGDTPAPLIGIGGMWWGGQAQGGWGISLMQQPGGLFAVWFTYDANGDPTWFVMPEGRWENATTYSGTLYKTRSSPFFGAVYDPSKLQVFPVGTFAFRFTNLDRATFDYDAEGHRGSMKIERQLF